MLSLQRQLRMQGLRGLTAPVRAPAHGRRRPISSSHLQRRRSRLRV